MNDMPQFGKPLAKTINMLFDTGPTMIIEEKTSGKMTVLQNKKNWLAVYKDTTDVELESDVSGMTFNHVVMSEDQFNHFAKEFAAHIPDSYAATFEENDQTMILVWEDVFNLYRDMVKQQQGAGGTNCPLDETAST